MSARLLIGSLACFLIIIFSTGCSSDEQNNYFDIGTGNETPYDVWLILYIDGQKEFEELVDGGDVGMGQGSSAWTISDGTHTLRVVAEDEDRNRLDEKTEKVDVKGNIYIDMLYTEKGLRMNITHENYLPPRSDNDPPMIKDGNYTQLDNGTYRFSVTYWDDDGDVPIEAHLQIDHYYVDEWGENRLDIHTYSLSYVEGSHKTGALYTAYVGSFEEGDVYMFAFTDGYNIAEPEDDTPYTDP